MSLLTRASKRIASPSQHSPSVARHFAAGAPTSAIPSSQVSRIATLGAQASVAGVLAVSASYLISHPGSLDSTAPRSGMLHYTDHAPAYPTAHSSTSTFGSAERSAESRGAGGRSSGVHLEANRELQFATMLAQSIRDRK